MASELPAEALAVRWKRLTPDAVEPTVRGLGTLALHAAADARIAPLGRMMVPTGIALALPPGCAGLAIPNRASAAELGFTFTNAPGLIDSGYRGEVALIVQNLDAARPLAISHGRHLCDLLVMPTLSCTPCGAHPTEGKEPAMDGLAKPIEVEFMPMEGEEFVPRYAHEGDNGMDLYAAHDVRIEPLSRCEVRFGVGIGLPAGAIAFIQPRSGLAAKRGLTIVDSPSLVVDPRPGDELSAVFANTDPSAPIELARGERVAQLVVLEAPRVRLVQVDELDGTQRGAGGFGSSGA